MVKCVVIQKNKFNMHFLLGTENAVFKLLTVFLNLLYIYKNRICLSHLLLSIMLRYFIGVVIFFKFSFMVLRLHNYLNKKFII